MVKNAHVAAKYKKFVLFFSLSMFSLSFYVFIDVIDFAAQWGNSPKEKKDLTSICYGTLWWIWKARCDRIFKNLRVNPLKVVDNIKSLVFTWIKHRRTKCMYSWVDWSISPFICL